MQESLKGTTELRRPFRTGIVWRSTFWRPPVCTRGMCKNAGTSAIVAECTCIGTMQTCFAHKMHPTEHRNLSWLNFFVLATTGKIFSAKRGDWKVHEIAHYCDHMTLGGIWLAVSRFFSLLINRLECARSSVWRVSAKCRIRKQHWCDKSMTYAPQLTCIAHFSFWNWACVFELFSVRPVRNFNGTDVQLHWQLGKLVWAHS